VTDAPPPIPAPTIPMWRHVVDPLLLVARLHWGTLLAMIGVDKLLNLGATRDTFATLGLPFPGVNALAAGVTETVGGALLAVGLFARPAAVPVLFCMLVAYASAHRAEAFHAAKPFWFFVAALLVLVLGPGRWSVDGRRAARRAAVT
jgi:putative oxidoreductase